MVKNYRKFVFDLFITSILNTTLIFNTIVSITPIAISYCKIYFVYILAIRQPNKSRVFAIQHMAPALLITSLEDLPTRGVAAFVRDLALRHGVSTTRTALDAWAGDVLTALKDGASHPLRSRRVCHSARL